MRFATIVAVILPFAAFAAPTPASRRADENELEDAVDRYNDGVNATSAALNSIEDQVNESNNPREQYALQAAVDAMNNLPGMSAILGGDNAGLKYVDSLCALR